MHSRLSTMKDMTAMKSEHTVSKQPVMLNETDASFAEEVSRRSGIDLSSCFHCRTCAGGCPFSEAMDYAPHCVNRLVQLGLKNEVLKCSSIWVCVGCNTCVVQCPMAIDIPVIMDVLRQIALEEKVVVAKPDILNFHKLLLQSVKRYGRTHKIEIMMRYKLIKRDWFSDMNVGMKMLAKRKLDILPSKIKNTRETRKYFK